MEERIDSLDRKILERVSVDARKPFLEIARECGVSGAAIHQRVQKLIRSGILHEAQFILDPYRLGYQTCAYIGISLAGINQLKSVTDALSEIPEIVECHATTGKYALFIKVYARDNKHLMQLLVNRVMPIPGVSHTETTEVSLDEIFSRQISLPEPGLADLA